MKRLVLIFFVLIVSLFNGFVSSMEHEIMFIIQNSSLEHIQEICDGREDYRIFLLHHLGDCRECDLIEVLDWLIGMGIDLNIKDERGETALHHAVRLNNVNLVEKLLICGVDDTIRNDEGFMSFTFANDFEMKSMFVEHRAYPLSRRLIRVPRTHDFHPRQKPWYSKCIKKITNKFR